MQQAVADHCRVIPLGCLAEVNWRCESSAHVAGVTQRVTSRLRPDRQPMRLRSDADGLDRAGRGVDGVDDVVVSAGYPEQLAVGADIAHVGTAAARDGPRRLD